jgi:hypothetical protein
MIMSDHRSPIASSVLATGHSLRCGEASSTIFFDLPECGFAKYVNQTGAMWLQFKT